MNRYKIIPRQIYLDMESTVSTVSADFMEIAEDGFIKFWVWEKDAAPDLIFRPKELKAIFHPDVVGKVIQE